ncbi:MAG: hypothetical protein GY696_13835, partial [Gammaproteobacteria bacterium]|nr:hypothetical protein [Gammaproteobacteria bacterium]
MPEGIYPADEQRVRVLVANNGSEGKLLLSGQKLEGLAVGEKREHIKPPAPAPRAAATQDEPTGVNGMAEPSTQEFSKLLEDLEIPENELLKKHPQTRKDLEQLVWEYQDIFSQDTPGCTDKVELDLELKFGTQPISQRFRDLNPELEQKLQDQINKWLEEGVIEASKSPWSSPLVPVKKKDGSVRWVVDYRLFNKHLVM